MPERHAFGSRTELLQIARELNRHKPCLLIIQESPEGPETHWLEVFVDLEDMLQDFTTMGIEAIELVPFEIPFVGFKDPKENFTWGGISKESFITHLNQRE